MKHRWPVFLVLFCWLAVLLAPPLRLAFWAQTFRPAPPYRGFGYGPSWMNPGSASFSPLPVNSADLAVRAIAVEEGKDAQGYNQSDNLKAAGYNALFRSRPDLLWLRARQLLYLRLWMKSGRLAGELDDVNWEKHRAQGAASPERGKEPANFTAREWQSAVAAAREAARREPDNGFWQWCLAEFLLDGGRDGEAFAALRAAASAPRFDRYDREYQAARLRAESARHGRALLPEEKLVFAAESSVSIAEQPTARLFAWQALKAERRGDHHTALDIELNLARLGLLSARGAYWDAQRLRGQNVIGIALRSRHRVKRPPGASRRLTQTQSAQRNVSSFLPYATAHGTAAQVAAAREIAARYVDSAREGDRLKGLANYGFVNGAVFVRVLTLSWAASATLWLLALALPLWLFVMALRRAVSVPDVEIAARDRKITAALGVFVLLALAAAVPSGLGWNYFPWGVLASDTQQPEAYLKISEALLWLTPFIALALLSCWCVIAVTLRFGRAAKAAGVAEPLTLGDWLNFGWGLLLGAAEFGAAVWWLNIANYGTGPYVGELGAYDWRRFHPLWPLAAFGVTLAVSWTRLLFCAPHRRSFASYRLRWLQSALGTLIVASSVFYLAFNVAALPLRAVADAEVNQLLQRGEVALMREKAGR